MHQLWRISILSMLLLCAVLIFEQKPHAETDRIQLIDWIGHNGVEDPTISTGQIVDAVVAGLGSSDSDIVSATVSALAWIAAFARQSDDDRRSTQSLSRNVALISGLKGFLLHFWEREFQQRSNPWIGSSTTQFVEIRNSKTVWRTEWVWLTIPAILATFYPKDPEVEDVLWQANHPDYPELLLSLLNVGEIESNEANNFRIQTLFNSNVSQVATVLAIDGLGKFQSGGGLAALVRRLASADIDYDLEATILNSIAAYDVKQTKPYQATISQKMTEIREKIPEDSTSVHQHSDALITYLLFLVRNGFEEDPPRN